MAQRGLCPLSVVSPSLWPLSAMTALRGLWPGALRGPWVVLPIKTKHRRSGFPTTTLPYEAALGVTSWRRSCEDVLPPLPPPLVPPVMPLVPKVPLVMPLVLTVLEPNVRGLRPVLVALRGLWPLAVVSPSLRGNHEDRGR